ncbi:YkgJ family cysteine cluster protein [Stieleria varia]|nr:YkgJ family cysteine cluster protein [Stieleria varia]
MNRSNIAPPIRRSRAQYPKSANLCEHCTAKCCRYFALPIDEPCSRKDYDYMRWYLLHEGASIFVEGDQWYLLVHAVCKHLQEDHRCGIYETRPEICREYTTDECEFDDDYCYELYFETPEQVDEYADAIYGPQFPDLKSDDRDSLRSRKPNSLPIL